LAAVLSGCTQSTAKIESYTAKEHHADIGRLLIVSDTWPLTSKGVSSTLQVPILEDALVKAFGKCGIVTNVVPQDQLPLAGGDTQAIRALSPDALLVLETKTYEDGVGGGGVYLAKIVDMMTKKMVWQAQISITTGTSREEVFAASIISRLKEDSIICPS
jgi:hypothetical protein